MTILIPYKYSPQLVLKQKTLKQALSQDPKTITGSGGPVWLKREDWHDEWARVQQLRLDNPDGLYGCQS